MKTPRLTDEQIAARLPSLPAWRLADGLLERTFAFADFVAAVRFVHAVADAAEEANHHPDIDIRWNRVRLALVTHDSGGITEKDFALAARADALA